MAAKAVCVCLVNGWLTLTGQLTRQMIIMLWILAARFTLAVR